MHESVMRKTNFCVYFEKEHIFWLDVYFEDFWGYIFLRGLQLLCSKRVIFRTKFYCFQTAWTGAFYWVIILGPNSNRTFGNRYQQPRELHTKKFFRNLIKLTRNQIEFTMHWLIWIQTDVRLDQNQSENGKYNLISGWSNETSEKFLCVCKVPPRQKFHHGFGRGYCKYN